MKLAGVNAFLPRRAATLSALALDFINPYQDQVSPDKDRPLPRAFGVGLAHAKPTRSYEIKRLACHVLGQDLQDRRL